MDSILLRTAGSLKVAVLHDADADPAFEEQAGKLFFFGRNKVLGADHPYAAFGEAAEALLRACWTALPIYLEQLPRLRARVTPPLGNGRRQSLPEPAGLAALSPIQTARLWPHLAPAERVQRAQRLLACEVQDFSHWLQGQVWRFEVRDSRLGIAVASCGAFYGEPQACLAAGLDAAGQIIAERLERRLLAEDGSYLNLDKRAVLAAAEDPGTRLRALIAPSREELAMLCGLASGIWQGQPGLALHPERLLSQGSAGIASALDCADADFALRQPGASLEALISADPARFFSRELRACFSASAPAAIQSLHRQTDARQGASLILDLKGEGMACRAAFPAELLQEALHALDREEARRAALQASWRRMEEEDGYVLPDSWREAMLEAKCEDGQDDPGMEIAASSGASLGAESPFSGSMPAGLSGPLSGPSSPLPELEGQLGHGGPQGLACPSPQSEAQNSTQSVSQGVLQGFPLGFPQGFPLAGWMSPEAGGGEGVLLGAGSAGEGGKGADGANGANDGESGNGVNGHDEREGDGHGGDSKDSAPSAPGQGAHATADRDGAPEAPSAFAGEEPGGQSGQASQHSQESQTSFWQSYGEIRDGQAGHAWEDGKVEDAMEAGESAKAIDQEEVGASAPGFQGELDAVLEACAGGPEASGSFGIANDPGGRNGSVGPIGESEAQGDPESAPDDEDGPDLLERGHGPGGLGDAEADPDMESHEEDSDGPRPW